jgi:hypothetical protein
MSINVVDKIDDLVKVACIDQRFRQDRPRNAGAGAARINPQVRFFPPAAPSPETTRGAGRQAADEYLTAGFRRTPANPKPRAAWSRPWISKSIWDC